MKMSLLIWAQARSQENLLEYANFGLQLWRWEGMELRNGILMK